MFTPSSGCVCNFLWRTFCSMTRRLYNGSPNCSLFQSNTNLGESNVGKTVHRRDFSLLLGRRHAHFVKSVGTEGDFGNGFLGRSHWLGPRGLGACMTRRGIPAVGRQPDKRRRSLLSSRRDSVALDSGSGGVASLNHRLQVFIPAGMMEASQSPISSSSPLLAATSPLARIRETPRRLPWDRTWRQCRRGNRPWGKGCGW